MMCTKEMGKLRTYIALIGLTQLLLITRAELTINEVNYNEFDNDFESRGAPGYEFIELYDGITPGLDMSLHVLVRFNQHGFVTARFNFTGRQTDAHGLFLIGGVFITNRDMDIPGLSCNNGGALALYKFMNPTEVVSAINTEPFDPIARQSALLDIVIWKEKAAMAGWLNNVHNSNPPALPINVTRLVENKYNTVVDESLTRCSCCDGGDLKNLTSFRSHPMTPKMPNVYCPGISLPTILPSTVAGTTIRPTTETTPQPTTLAETTPPETTQPPTTVPETTERATTRVTEQTTQVFTSSPGTTGIQTTTVCVTMPGELNTTLDFTTLPFTTTQQPAAQTTQACPTEAVTTDGQTTENQTTTVDPFSACPWVTDPSSPEPPECTTYPGLTAQTTTTTTTTQTTTTTTQTTTTAQPSTATGEPSATTAWTTGDVPTTTPIGCGPPPVVAHAWIEAWTGNVTSVGSTVTYACKAGYSHMIGSALVECLLDLTWSSSPACYKDCQAIAVLNATLLYSNELQMDHSSKLLIECDEGFYLSQDEDMICDTGHWVPGSITCKPLPPPPALPALPVGFGFISSHDNGTDAGNGTVSMEDVFTVEWGKWLEWTSCTASCGKGLRLRVKLCHPADINCTSNPLDMGECYMKECPVDGEWLEWSQWTNCSSPCDSGTMLRSRECYGPFYEGRLCDGRDTEREVCEIEPCPDTGKKRVKKIVFSEGYTDADKRESAETVGSIAIAIISLEFAAIILSDVNPYTIYHFGKKVVQRYRRWKNPVDYKKMMKQAKQNQVPKKKVKKLDSLKAKNTNNNAARSDAGSRQAWL